MIQNAPQNRMELEGVVVRYHEGYDVLSSINISFAPNRCTLVLGPNGSGKSTLLKAMAALVPLAEGRILFDGLDLARVSTRERFKMGIAYISADDRVFPALTVRENLLVGLADWDRPARDRQLRRAYSSFPWLESMRDKLAVNLSGGEQQILSMQRAIIAGAEFLLLDEPTSGLAPGAADTIKEELLKIVAQDDISIVLAEHNVNWTFDLCNDFVCLREGEVFASGDISLLRDDAAVVQRMFL